MREDRILIVGCRSDALSAAIVDRTVTQLVDAHTKSRIEVYGSHGDGGISGGAAHGRRIEKQLPLLGCGKVDIVAVDASAIPVRLDPAFTVAALLKRGNPFDVFVSLTGGLLDDQPERARIAAAGELRTGQLLYFRPDLKMVGDVSDLASCEGLLENGLIEGCVLPAAEVEALGRQNRVVEVFTSSLCMPAAGQGAVALVVRSDDREAALAARAVGHRPSLVEFELERIFLRQLRGVGVGLVGVLGSAEELEFVIEAAIVAPDGSERVFGSITGPTGSEEKGCRRLADELLAGGGEQIINAEKTVHGRQER